MLSNIAGDTALSNGSVIACGCKDVKSKGNANAFVCQGGGGHWVLPCCLTKRRRCVLHPLAKLLPAPALWKKVVTSSAAFWCPGGHLVIDDRGTHLQTCPLIKSKRDQLRALRPVESVSTIGLTNVRCGDGDLGVEASLTFVDGNLSQLDVVTFMATTPVFMAIKLSDQNLTIQHEVVVNKEGSQKISWLPTISAALYTASRRVTVKWSPTKSSSPSALQSERPDLLHQPPHAPRTAPCGKPAATKPLCAHATEESIGVAGIATEA